jgi:ABC-type multidrug transport system fused ATPase/permease subunit
MNEYLEFSSKWLIILLGLSFFLILILFILNLSNRSRLRKLRDRYYKFMSGVAGENIEYLLEQCLSNIEQIREKNREMENHINDIERRLLDCIQKVGMVRYNAFDDVGSDLSYSVAMLDSNDDGLVLSGLYARETSTTYAKPVVNGKSKYALSVEELKAIDIARKRHRASY